MTKITFTFLLGLAVALPLFCSAGSQTVTASSDARDYSLSVSTAHGVAEPADGTHSDYCWGSVVTCSVSSVVMEGNTEWTCTGWSGSGSVPAVGTEATTGEIVLSDVSSSITWTWSSLERFIMEEFSASNSFSEVGVAQGWSDDDAYWELDLPFAFPFYGKTYSSCFVDSNGCIYFGEGKTLTSNSEANLKANCMVAVLWQNLRMGDDGDIFIKTGPDTVTIRWAADFYGTLVNCSATLYADGNIRLSYGSGNHYIPVTVGVSAGDGVDYTLSAEADNSGYMNEFDDIIFSSIGGIVEAVDLDDDGLHDSWEVQYFGSTEACDPLADGDEDGFTNLDEFLSGTNPKEFDAVLNHFAWSAIENQVDGVPFNVQITAMDQRTNTFTGFSGILDLSVQTSNSAPSEIAIGVGTETWDFPMRTYYEDARTQVIYLQEDVGVARSISSLALDVQTVPGGAMENWTIRMRHTSLDNYETEANWESDWTTVLQQTLTVSETGWLVFNFDTPFEYDGTSNLMIDFSYNNSNYSENGLCRASDVGTVRALSYKSDSLDGDPLTWAEFSGPIPDEGSIIPNIKLGVQASSSALTPLVTGHFVSGVWQGELELNGIASELALVAEDDAGHRGLSNTFSLEEAGAAPVLHHFTWNTISNQVDGQTFDVQITAYDQQTNTFTEFSGALDLEVQNANSASREVIVGEGTNTWNYPMSTLYHDARTQVIYLQDEVGEAGSINSLALDVQALPGGTMENWTLRMRHTDLDEYSSVAVWETNWITVLQQDLTVDETGWLVCDFDTPFEYNGVQNLMIDFSFDNSMYTSDGTCRATDVGSSRTLSYRTDSQYGDPLLWSSDNPPRSAGTKILNIKLGMVEASSVQLSPVVTASFSNGVWQGSLQLSGTASELILVAEDDAGHRGQSNIFSLEAATGTPDDLDADGISDLWEVTHFGSAEHCDPELDADNDGETNWEEFIALTDPKQGGSLFTISISANAENLTWYGAEGRYYQMEYCDDLAAKSWATNATLFLGANEMISVPVVDILSESKCYRVRVMVQDNE